MVTVEIRVARGWKSIAELVGVSERHVKRMAKSGRLPVRYDGSTPTITNIAVLEYYHHLPTSEPSTRTKPGD